MSYYCIAQGRNSVTSNDSWMVRVLVIRYRLESKDTNKLEVKITIFISLGKKAIRSCGGLYIFDRCTRISSIRAYKTIGNEQRQREKYPWWMGKDNHLSRDLLTLTCDFWITWENVTQGSPRYGKLQLQNMMEPQTKWKKVCWYPYGIMTAPQCCHHRGVDQSTHNF